MATFKDDPRLLQLRGKPRCKTSLDSMETIQAAKEMGSGPQPMPLATSGPCWQRPGISRPGTEELWGRRLTVLGSVRLREGLSCGLPPFGSFRSWEGGCLNPEGGRGELVLSVHRSPENRQLLDPKGDEEEPAPRSRAPAVEMPGPQTLQCGASARRGTF